MFEYQCNSCQISNQIRKWSCVTIFDIFWSFWAPLLWSITWQSCYAKSILMANIIFILNSASKKGLLGGEGRPPKIWRLLSISAVGAPYKKNGRFCPTRGDFWVSVAGHCGFQEEVSFGFMTPQPQHRTQIRYIVCKVFWKNIRLVEIWGFSEALAGQNQRKRSV